MMTREGDTASSIIVPVSVSVSVCVVLLLRNGTPSGHDYFPDFNIFGAVVRIVLVEWYVLDGQPMQTSDTSKLLYKCQKVGLIYVIICALQLITMTA
jgi:hypothetical protein